MDFNLCQKVIENIKHVVVGKQRTIELLLVTLLAEGHVLLEDVPGVAKTLLAKCLAKSIGGTFNRVQFTPDMMPTDITGFNVYDLRSARFSFRPGPVITHVLLASDLFGFFKTTKQHFQRLEIIVYPRIVALKPIYMPKRDLFGTPGNQSPVKDPVYIIGTQDYQPARPARHIHWKASARHLKLQEKVFEPSQQGKIMVGLNVAAFEQDLANDAFESTLEVVAALILQLERMDLAVGFLTNGALKGASIAWIPTRRGSHQLAAILEILGRLQMKRHTAFKALINQTPDLQRGATWVYFGYRKDKGLYEMHTYCRAVNTTCVFFTWNRESLWQKNPPTTLPDIHGIQDLRPDNLEQT